MSGGWPPVIVEVNPSPEARTGLGAGLPDVPVDALILQRSPKTLDENIPKKRPLPFIAMRMPASRSGSVQAMAANCEPWFVLLIWAGSKRAIASSSASAQNFASSEFYSRWDSTRRPCQSMISTR